MDVSIWALRFGKPVIESDVATQDALRKWPDCV